MTATRPWCWPTNPDSSRPEADRRTLSGRHSAGPPPARLPRLPHLRRCIDCCTILEDHHDPAAETRSQLPQKHCFYGGLVLMSTSRLLNTSGNGPDGGAKPPTPAGHCFGRRCSSPRLLALNAFWHCWMSLIGESQVSRIAHPSRRDRETIFHRPALNITLSS